MRVVVAAEEVHRWWVVRLWWSGMRVGGVRIVVSEVGVDNL